MPLTHSPETDKIDDALAKARGEYLPIEKGRTAEIPGKFSYDFADLSDVFAASSAALAKHGISIMQDAWVDYSEPVPRVSVQTRLALAGQWYESSVMTLPVTADSKLSVVQLIGSAESFGRRYQAIAMLAVQPKGDDDDGHGAGGTEAKTDSKAPRADMPECPSCKTNKSVIKGREEFGGGYVCYKAKQGCGAKWHAEQTPPSGTQMTEDQQRQAQSGEGSKVPPKDAPQTEAAKPRVNKVFEAVRTRLHEIGCQNASEASAVIRFVVGQEEHGGYRWGTIEDVKNDPAAPAAVILALGKAKEVGVPDSTILHDALEQAGLLEPAGAAP